MSEQPGTPPAGEFIELPSYGDVAFASLMDVLVTEEGLQEGSEAGSGEGAAPGAAPAADPAGAATGPAGGSEAPGGGTEPAGQPAPPADGAPAAPPGGGAAGDVQPPAQPEPVVPAVSPDFVAKLGTLSTTIEENVTNALRREAFDAVQAEHPQYFAALDKHPRLLIGTQVPSLQGEGMETLKSTDDAREWQEAVKSLLVQEIDSRAQTKLGDTRAYLETIHASVDLFKNNPDLVPGAKGFNRQLADQFASMAAPYEVRVEGKLRGYSIPVQPLIDNLRKQLASSPAATPPAVPAGAPGPDRPAAPVEPPQAAIPAKAGSSSEQEDFSTLFGTIGLPNLQI